MHADASARATIGQVIALALGLAVTGSGSALVGAARAQDDTIRSGTEELVMLAISLDLAQAACGFPVDRPAFQAYLAARGTSPDALYGGPLTPPVQRFIADQSRRLVGERVSACDELWRSFGSGGDRAQLLKPRPDTPR